MKTAYICPNCKKEVSEFSLSCPNCGMSFSDISPFKSEPISISEKAKEIRISKRCKIGIIISLLLGIISTVILTQAIKVINIIKGMVTSDGLFLFKDNIANMSIHPMPIIICLSSLLLIATIISTLICIVKIIMLNRKNNT